MQRNGERKENLVTRLLMGIEISLLMGVSVHKSLALATFILVEFEIGEKSDSPSCNCTSSLHVSSSSLSFSAEEAAITISPTARTPFSVCRCLCGRGFTPVIIKQWIHLWGFTCEERRIRDEVDSLCSFCICMRHCCKKKRLVLLEFIYPLKPFHPLNSSSLWIHWFKDCSQWTLHCCVQWRNSWKWRYFEMHTKICSFLFLFSQ